MLFPPSSFERSKRDHGKWDSLMWNDGIRWKAPNVYREKWNVNGIPMLVKFEYVDGVVSETGRLDEDGIMDEKILSGFIGK